MTSEQKMVLVVEMTPIIEELLVRIFTLVNYRICTVDWRQIAKHEWMNHMLNTLPDSIILDVDIYANAMLRDPLDFVRSFSTHWNARFRGTDKPPLILLTTQARRQNELQQENFVDAVVTKPFKPQFLLHTVKTLMEQRQEREAREQESIHIRSEHIPGDLNAIPIRKVLTFLSHYD